MNNSRTKEKNSSVGRHSISFISGKLIHEYVRNVLLRFGCVIYGIVGNYINATLVVEKDVYHTPKTNDIKSSRHDVFEVFLYYNVYI